MAGNGWKGRAGRERAQSWGGSHARVARRLVKGCSSLGGAAGRGGDGGGAGLFSWACSALLLGTASSFSFAWALLRVFMMPRLLSCCAE